MPGVRVREVTGDVLDQPVEALVNAWNRNFVPRRLLLTAASPPAPRARRSTAAWRRRPTAASSTSSCAHRTAADPLISGTPRSSSMLATAPAQWVSTGRQKAPVGVSDPPR